MKIECLHGYFRFTETKSGQMSDFMSLFELEIAPSKDHFTFTDLVDAPDFSLPGGDFLGCPTTVSFEGMPWEVMKANAIVYNFVTGEVVPIASVIQAVKISSAGNFLVTSGMILPGSVTEDGERVKDYAAFYESGRGGFKYSAVTLE